MDVFLILVGLLLLYVGGEGALRGAIALAKKVGVSPAMIGLTVIGFGTSAPELVVTLQAAMDGQPDLAIGNVVGSNISNILLIVGVGGLITPLVCDPKALRRDGMMMQAAMILLVILGISGEIVFWQGALMLAVLISYLVWSYIRDKREGDVADLHEREVEELQNVPENIAIILLYLAFGLAGLVGGAHVLVEGAVNIATRFGVPESIIGLTIVALGTSLPELAATIISAVRKHADVAVANVMGSCLFNILSILGITSMVHPLSIAADIRQIDIWVMLAASLALVPMLFGDLKICRRDAAILLAGYVIYMGSIAARLPI